MQYQRSAAGRWLRRGLWLAGVVVPSWALAWLGVPWLLKTQLETLGTEQLGRAVRVDAVEFKPWSLELTLTGLSIAGREGSPPLLQIRRLYANAELESLLRLAPVVDSLVVQGPQLRLTHLGNGKYDIDDILARLAGPARAGPEPASGFEFALFNLSLKDGALDFDDRSVQRIHQLRELTLGIPFISNLESRRTVKVEPRLSFVVDGSRFESTAQSTPFAPTRETEVRLRLRDKDLSPYLAYVPDSVPVRLQQAILGADLQLAFVQTPKPTVKLSGSVDLSAVKLANLDNKALLAFDRLTMELGDVRPLERVVRIGSVELTAPRLHVRHAGSGRTNLDFPQPAPAAPPPAAAQTAASAASPVSAVATAAADDAGWKVEIARLAVRDGTAHWLDEAVTPRASLAVRELGLEVTGITWPMLQPAPFQGSAALLTEPPVLAAKGPAAGPAQAASALGPPARLVFSGSGTGQNAALKLSLDGVPLVWAAPYLAQWLEPPLRGRMQAELGVSWKAPDLQLNIPSLVLDDLALAEPGAGARADLASVKSLHLTQAQVDLAARSVTVGKLAIEQPRLALVRGEDQRWMFERWLKAAPPAPAAGGVATRTSGPAGTPPAWTLQLADLALDGGTVAYLDKAAGKPVVFELSALQLRMKNVRPDGNRPAPVQLSGRIRTERGEPGQLEYRGTLQMMPLVAQGSVVATQLPVHAFEPYFGGGLNIELLRADTSFKGDLRYAANTAGPALKVAGDVLLEEFRANSVAASDGGLQIAEELLSWKALNLRGLEMAQAPGTATTVAVKETTVSDFFARVIVHESGRINLQNLVKSSEVAEPVAAANAPALAVPDAAARSAASSRVASAVAVAGPEPVVTIGPISLINGKVFFSDRFVKPNYSANLSDLTGKLSAFSSVAPQGQQQLADLELRGRAEGTASLEILGKLNPLAQPLALDIQGKVRDLELPPLSPYSVKYAGHGIERGKLSVDVAYLVLPNGQLTASNKLVLNQLTFSDKVDGAPASLPVKLAVALLADRNGVIDIDLPVSGSLNDPQFRLGPIIFKVIVNLIVRAVTAPFSLLASAFGGAGDELSSVAFAPGSAALSPQARGGLDKVARALAERPALRMTVVGTSSLEAEREAYKRERLRALLLAEKRRVLVTSGATAAAAQEAASATALTDAEMPALLSEVFRRADIAKPRNLVGLVKELPVPEMEALLLANIPVTDEAMRELALQRGVAVKDYLGARQLPVERLFLGAVKPVAADEKWSPRAELVLATN